MGGRLVESVFVIFDLEFTSWAGAQERGWTGPGEFREVVQIGALRVDGHTLVVDEEFDVLVRPARNPVLDGYFEALTGISNEDVAAKGQDFASALNAFVKFCNGDYTISYGNDMVILGENLVLQFPADQQPECALPPFVNIRPYVNRKLPRTVNASSGGLGAVLGGEPGPEHNALGDCYGILTALRALRHAGEPLFCL